MAVHLTAMISDMHTAGPFSFPRKGQWPRDLNVAETGLVLLDLAQATVLDLYLGSGGRRARVKVPRRNRGVKCCRSSFASSSRFDPTSPTYWFIPGRVHRLAMKIPGEISGQEREITRMREEGEQEFVETNRTLILTSSTKYTGNASQRMNTTVLLILHNPRDEAIKLDDDP